MSDASDRPPEQLPEHVAHNREYWDGMADWWAERGAQDWARAEPRWGIWGIPESELKMLPEDMAGLDAVELGCGTAYVSAWMSRRGAKVTGIDNSANQLATARALAAHHDLSITLVHGNAEETPFPDESFDFAISEYGAAIWCDPYRWIPEAHRILRPGGRLVFLGNHPMASVCSPLDGTDVIDRLVRDYFDLHEQDYSQVEVDPGGIEFNLPISGWVALFHHVGFTIEGFLEPRAPLTETRTDFSVPPEWAKRWPSEQVWKLRKR